jgi:hypothetical protein
MHYLDERLIHQKLRDYRHQAELQRLAPTGRTRKGVARLLHRAANALEAEPRTAAGSDFPPLQPAHTSNGMRIHHD